MVPAKKPHISPSQIDTYNKCPEQWRRRYVERHIIPPGVALIQGTSIHKGSEHNFAQKIKTREDRPKEEVAGVVAAAFDDVVKRQGIELSDEEKSIGKAKVLGEAKDQTVALAGLYSDEVAPAIQPASVEEEIKIELEESTHDLLGYLDLTTEQGSVDDLKTSAKSAWKQRAATHTQFIMYSLMYKAKHKKDPSEIRVHELVKTKTPKYNLIDGIRFSKEDYRPLVARINAVLKGINGGFFPPATPGAWWCSPKFCGYWATCPYVNGERKAAAEASQ